MDAMWLHRIVWAFAHWPDGTLSRGEKAAQLAEAGLGFDTAKSYLSITCQRRFLAKAVKGSVRLDERGWQYLRYFQGLPWADGHLSKRWVRKLPEVVDEPWVYMRELRTDDYVQIDEGGDFDLTEKGRRHLEEWSLREALPE